MSIENDNDRPIWLMHAIVAIVAILVMASPMFFIFWLTYEVIK